MDFSCKNICFLVIIYIYHITQSAIVLTNSMFYVIYIGDPYIICIFLIKLGAFATNTPSHQQYSTNQYEMPKISESNNSGISFFIILTHIFELYMLYLKQCVLYLVQSSVLLWLLEKKTRILCHYKHFLTNAILTIMKVYTIFVLGNI